LLRPELNRLQGFLNFKMKANQDQPNGCRVGSWCQLVAGGAEEGEKAAPECPGWFVGSVLFYHWAFWCALLAGSVAFSCLARWVPLALLTSETVVALR
jgi:hypothetical protein